MLTCLRTMSTVILLSYSQLVILFKRAVHCLKFICNLFLFNFYLYYPQFISGQSKHFCCICDNPGAIPFRQAGWNGKWVSYYSQKIIKIVIWDLADSNYFSFACILFFTANMERSNLYLKLFKLVFGSVSLFASENEQMLKVGDLLALKCKMGKFRILILTNS